MDIGDSDHILMTSSMAESLLELSDNFKKIIHPLHNYQIKHGDVVFLYSVHDESFGNAKRPSKGLFEETKSIRDTQKMRKTILYHNVQFNLQLKDSRTNLLEFTRNYEFINNSEEPVFEVVNRIVTNVDKTLSALKIKVFDENQKELKISGINVDAPYWKEFTIKFTEPVLLNQMKKYSITYRSEEPTRTHENLFLISSEHFSVRFIFPTEMNINPRLYAIQSKDREKILLNITPNKKQGVLTQLEWKTDDGIKENDIIRLEW